MDISMLVPYRVVAAIRCGEEGILIVWESCSQNEMNFVLDF